MHENTRLTSTTEPSSWFGRALLLILLSPVILAVLLIERNTPVEEM